MICLDIIDRLMSMQATVNCELFCALVQVETHRNVSFIFVSDGGIFSIENICRDLYFLYILSCKFKLS